MRVRFKGEADGLPCEVFGQVFPVGEWMPVDGIALKLVTNPMFDADGAVAPKAVVSEPQPEPDLDADEDDEDDDPPAAVSASATEPVPVVEEPASDMTADEARAILTARGVKFHHKAGLAKLLELVG